MPVSSDRIDETIIVTAQRLRVDSFTGLSQRWWDPAMRGPLGAFGPGARFAPDGSLIIDRGNDAEPETSEELVRGDESERPIEEIISTPVPGSSGGPLNEATWILASAGVAARVVSGASAAEVQAAQTLIRGALVEIAGTTAANEAVYAARVSHLMRILNAARTMGPTTYTAGVIGAALIMAGALGVALYVNEQGWWVHAPGSPPPIDIKIDGAIVRVTADYNWFHVNVLPEAPAAKPWVHPLAGTPFPEISWYQAEQMCLAAELVAEHLFEVSPEYATKPLPELEVAVEVTHGYGLKISIGVGVAMGYGPSAQVARDPAPETQPELRPVPQENLDPAERILRIDTKWKSQARYIALLSFLNRTWGEISEIKDMVDVFRASLYRPDGKPLRSWKDVYDGWRAREIELDMDRFIIMAFVEQMTDLMWGKLSNMERDAMLDAFGPGDWRNNVMGLPSTWARRAMKMYNLTMRGIPG